MPQSHFGRSERLSSISHHFTPVCQQHIQDNCEISRWVSLLKLSFRMESCSPFVPLPPLESLHHRNDNNECRADVRYYWCWIVWSKGYAEWRKESQTFIRCLGQAK
ncbi:hypothetical protein EYC84_003357 [Monilinia fructicola]|uniref:Uncharacterized protein n=1 Tax=Monilinia fructicola TaxID=38448 RepID=A0A5M9JWD3_MONFR|nr:hypothetical protein EYC84_003357 [Monilinia fructicola]